MADGYDTRMLAEIHERLGEVKTGVANLGLRLDQSEERAATSRAHIKSEVERLQGRVGDLEHEMHGVKADTHRAAEFIDAAGIKEAERRGAMAAVRMVWHHTSWMGRFLGVCLVAAVAYLGDSLLSMIRAAINAFLDGGPG